MATLWRLKRSNAGFAIILLVTSLIGCDETNLKGYRPANDQLKGTESSTGAKGSDSQSGSVDGDFTQSVESKDILPASALVPINVVDGVRGLMSIPTPDPSVTGTIATQPDGVESTPGAADLPNTGPRRVEVLIKEKSFQTESKTGGLRVSFDDLDLLKVLNMDPVVANAVELMPDWLKGLNGKTIRIRGFMYPTFDTEGIERFVLARDNQICCFGRDPKVYDLVQVDMKAGKTTNYIPPTRAFDVAGKFKIDLQVDDGKPYGLYVIEDAIVIDR